LTDIVIPAQLEASCTTPDRQGWLRQLPRVISDLLQRWRLTLRSGHNMADGTCSWVSSVLRADGEPAVLKIGMPHFEAEHEIAGLRFWSGEPTVLLLEADEDLNAMLLEACEPGSSLREQPEREQDAVVAGLLRRLWRVPSGSHRFRPLAAMTDFWIRETRKAEQQWADTGLVKEGLHLFETLSRNVGTETLLATDLHAGNVLRARREPWLVIDPKPFVGDPAFDTTQHLLNHRERLKRDWKGTIHRFATLLGVDPDRVRLWLFARTAAEPRADWRHDELSDIARILSEAESP
jgi:streptomycin 6-kinase